MLATPTRTLFALFCTVAIAACDQQSAATTGSMQTASAAASQSAPAVNYQRQVSLAVGESVVVHGLRGDCGSLPTSAQIAEATSDLNAKTSLGRFSFGSQGVRRSGSCGGQTPVLQTIFTATMAGQETVSVHGDPVEIIVR